jgi:hypothetical protein
MTDPSRLPVSSLNPIIESVDAEKVLDNARGWAWGKAVFCVPLEAIYVHLLQDKHLKNLLRAKGFVVDELIQGLNDTAESYFRDLVVAWSTLPDAQQKTIKQMKSEPDAPYLVGHESLTDKLLKGAREEFDQHVNIESERQIIRYISVEKTKGRKPTAIGLFDHLAIHCLTHNPEILADLHLANTANQPGAKTISLQTEQMIVGNTVKRLIHRTGRVQG